MRRFIAGCSLTAMALFMLTLAITPVAALEIPNTSILPNGKLLSVPVFIGEPAVANPILNVPPIPQNPNMGNDPWSCAHDDSFMSDIYPGAGPLGINPVVSSTCFITPGLIATAGAVATFDKNGLMVAGVSYITGTEETWVQLTLIDPRDLSTLAELSLPPETGAGGGTGTFRPAGTYFYQDDQDRTIIGTPERTIWVVSHSKDSSGKWSFTHEDTWDLTEPIIEGDSIEAIQPDWSGRLWFTSKDGVVGTLDTSTGKVIGFTRELQERGERIVNSHAAGSEGGVYIVSSLAMYRFDADSDGKPEVTWRKTYDAGTHQKEGQVDTGSGTTPTLMGEKYVAITDNGQPWMHVLVYSRDDGDLVCSEPVFKPGSASNENSLIATDKSIIVENNFGYTGPKATTHGKTTTPGIARIDVKNGSCYTVWTNDSVSIPTVVSKMSIQNGLIYTYTKPKGPATTDPWYFTAIDFHTGEVVWRVLAGYGIYYNNNYAPSYLAPDGSYIVGVLGGFVKMHDAE